ncbi:PGF-pre-PGF domain-containing protein [Methanococcoides sp. NM1]|uniref:PGF-pre-PGF domain-containing protein n=1 Tax=Methanococcoides sp. NM1 TaxID=1201013 RepID=UPI0014385F61|nr:PGF-pre-PGF domain-containing protein [Methanococcoides sp. NM1]
MVLLIILSSPALASSDVTLAPISQTVEVGDTFTISVFVSPDRPIAGMQFDLIFDRSLVNVRSVTEGDLLNQKGAFVFFDSGNIANSQGRVDSVYGLLIDKTTVTSSGTFAIISLSSIDSGVCNFKLSNVVVSDSNGNAIPINVVNSNVVIKESDTASSGGGGDDGSSVGGSSVIGSTVEDIDNVEQKYISRLYVYKDANLNFNFNATDNDIRYVRYLALKNAGNIVTIVEVLENTSVFVEYPPEDVVYKNINVWVGTIGYDNEENMDNSIVGFRVPRDWIEDNNIDVDSIRLNHYYDQKWNAIPTTKVYEDASYLYFESKVSGFSFFSITGQLRETESLTDNESSSDQDETLDQNLALLLIMAVLVLSLRRKK